MKYISSDENKFSLEIQASIHNKMEHFALVEKKYILDDENHKTIYDWYELSEKESNHDFKEETLESFCTKYMEQAEGEEVEVTSVEIFQDGKSVTEISRLIEVLVFEPDKPAYVKAIQKTRTAYKEIVEGDTEYISLGGEYILVCNEIGMLIKLPHNRGYYGTFFVAKNIDGYCDSLTSKDIALLTKELDKRENFESKSKYLQEYFQNNPIERQMFPYSFDNNVHYIATESIIEFLLGQTEKEKLQMIELEVRAIEQEGGDILDYLKHIGKQMAQKQNRAW